MISDEERRQAASRLREELALMRDRRDWYRANEDPTAAGNLAYRNIAGSVIPGSNIGSGYIEVVERLADLIDARADEGEAAMALECDEAALPPRRCLVDGERCLFHLVYVKHWTHGASSLIGGFPAGQESRLFALVEGSDGTMREVPATRVRLLDSEMLFGGCRWGDALASGRKSSDDERTGRGGRQTSQSMPK